MPYALSAHANDFFAPRVVTVTPAADECMGKTDDMLCIFDTVIACAVRRDARLCEMVGLAYDAQFIDAFNVLAGQDYEYGPVELFINRRRGICSIDDGRSCVTNIEDGEMIRADASVRDNNNVGIFMRRERGGHWSVIYAMQFACWPDEDCS